MALHDRGKVKIRGYNITLIESDSGTWSTNYVSGASSREDVIKKTAAAIKQEEAESEERNAAQHAAMARRVRCDACGKYVVNMAQHEKTPSHQRAARNAAAYSEYQRSRRF